MRCTVIVMAKAPLPGLAKTRLIPALGADGAAQLAARLLDRVVTQALATGLGPVDLCVTPDATQACWSAWAQRSDLALSSQVEGDLGRRMDAAFNRVLREQPAALLVGTDAPALDATYLRRAAAALVTHDAVYGPAADGGYVLVGLKRPQPALFDGMRWSHDQVMAHTRQRLAAAGLRHAELPPLHDIDDPADLVHLPPGLAP
jgi:hypothetical protein